MILNPLIPTKIKMCPLPCNGARLNLVFCYKLNIASNKRRLKSSECRIVGCKNRRRDRPINRCLRGGQFVQDRSCTVAHSSAECKQRTLTTSTWKNPRAVPSGYNLPHLHFSEPIRQSPSIKWLCSAKSRKPRHFLKKRKKSTC